MNEESKDSAHGSGGVVQETILGPWSGANVE